MAVAEKRKLVALVTTEILTPYKAGEVFCVTEADAKKLLTRDLSKNEYGIPRNPKVKVRLFDVKSDGDTLLDNHSLNLHDHNLLLAMLHPEEEPVQITSPQYRSEITDLLDELDPNRDKAKGEKVEDERTDASLSANELSEEHDKIEEAGEAIVRRRRKS